MRRLITNQLKQVIQLAKSKIFAKPDDRMIVNPIEVTTVKLANSRWTKPRSGGNSLLIDFFRLH